MAPRTSVRLKWLPLALALLAWTTRDATAQIAPTGGHYAARGSDTGFTGGVTSSGGYSASVPLDLPPSRGGIPIPLSVVYTGHGVGALGLGWDVPISYVRMDQTFAHRRPAYAPGTAPAPRQQITVSLGGQVFNLVPHGTTNWVAQNGSLRLTGTWNSVFWQFSDGNGIAYRFTQPAALNGAGIWLLTSIYGRGGAIVALTYSVGYVSLPGSPALYGVPAKGIYIDLGTITYNQDTANTCAKDMLQLVYYSAAPAPLSMSVLGSKILARTRILGNIYVRRRPNCSTDSVLLKNYTFVYPKTTTNVTDSSQLTGDADTGLPRLTSVTVSARTDSNDYRSGVLPVANYAYGSATSQVTIDANGPQKGIDYQLVQTIPWSGNPISMTQWNGISPPNIAFTTPHKLIDVTGDGRPDFVYSQNGQLWFQPNQPGGSGATAFGQAIQLTDTIFTSGPLEGGDSDKGDRYSLSSTVAYSKDEIWRMAIDMNGDGRIDFVDAKEQAGAWSST